MMVHGQRRNVGRARHEVVHEGCGHQLTVHPVKHLLAQHLPKALGHATVDLSLHDGLVQDIPDIVDCRVSEHGDDPGLRSISTSQT